MAGRTYVTRVVDGELDDLMTGLPAISLEGPRGVGKTATAMARAATVYRLDDPDARSVINADVRRVGDGAPPILIDEWQLIPATWDVVRRSVDDDRTPGRFLLTGSATPTDAPMHSGAGRIVRVRMHTMTLPERGVSRPTVSLAELLSGSRPMLAGASDVRLGQYVDEIVASGFPGLRGLPERMLRRELDGYIDRIVDVDFPMLGHTLRNPAALRRWLAAYAAATATTATFETIREAGTGGEGQKPSRTTVTPYHDILTRLWILDPLPAWFPSSNMIKRLAGSPKHHLADPALAARLLNVGREGLLAGRDGHPSIQRSDTLLGALFESLACLSIRVFAQAADARVSHFRTKAGEREIDLIVEGDDGRLLAIEVKLTEIVGDDDVRHLRWLGGQLGDRLSDAIVVTTGRYAFRRQDGVGVVPLALLGP